MTKPKTAAHPQGATLSLGGTAYAHPTLEPILEPITEPVLYPGNPRRGDQDAITGSIRDLGLYAGIICQRTTRHVLVGNHRLRGLLALEAEQVPVTWVDVDNTRAAAIVARDNLTSDRGGYDTAEQITLLQALAADDALPLSGYADDNIEDLQRVLANLTFAEEALAAHLADTPEAASGVSPPIDVEGDGVRVTVTVDPDHKADLYALLHDQPWVRDVADAHTRKPPA